MKRLFYLLLIVFFTQCSTDIDVSSSNKIFLSPAENPIRLDSIFDSYEVFHAKDLVFSYVRFIHEFDSALLIKAANDDYGLFMYDKRTNQTSGIARKGRGPNEFWIIAKPELYDDGFYVADRMNLRITKFDQAGNNEGYIKIEDGFEGLIHRNDTIAYLYKDFPAGREPSGEYKITVYDLKADTMIYQYYPLNSLLAEQRAVSSAFSLNNYSDTIVLSHVLCDTVYNVFDTGISPRYIFDVGGLGIPVEMMNDPEIDLGTFFNKVLASDYIWFFLDYYETHNHVYITFTHNKIRNYAFFNKNTRLTSIGSGIHDNMIFGKSFEYKDFMPVGKGDNCMYFAVNPLAILNNESVKSDLPTENKLIEDLHESDNQIIVKLNFIKQ